MRILIFILFFSNIAIASPTFEKDIRPLFLKRCSICHNESTPDRNWNIYKIAKKNAEKIKNRVFIKKDMPMGNATNMTEAERIIVKKWIDNGAKK